MINSTQPPHTRINHFFGNQITVIKTSMARIADSSLKAILTALPEEHTPIFSTLASHINDINLANYAQKFDGITRETHEDGTTTTINWDHRGRVWFIDAKSEDGVLELQVEINKAWHADPKSKFSATIHQDKKLWFDAQGSVLHETQITW